MESVAEESGKMKAVQKEAVAKQVRLDGASLNRLKEAEAKNKVKQQQDCRACGKQKLRQQSDHTCTTDVCGCNRYAVFTIHLITQ